MITPTFIYVSVNTTNAHTFSWEQDTNGQKIPATFRRAPYHGYVLFLHINHEHGMK